jgi:hypothetical protein
MEIRYDYNTNDLEGLGFDLIGQDEQADLVVLVDDGGYPIAGMEVYGNNEIHTIETLFKREGNAAKLVRQMQEEQDYIIMRKVCDECVPFAKAMGFIQIDNSSDWDWEFEEEFEEE